jgi:hypothetical protein
MNPYRDTDREARQAVRRFKRTLPACIRKTVHYVGVERTIFPELGPVKAIFEDINGKHTITISE